MSQDEQFGPAMNALNPQQRAWVMAMYEQGTMDATEAARTAGYVDNANGAIRVTAHRIAQRPDVKAAMQEEARRRITLMLPIADRALASVVQNAQHKDQIRAVAMIYNRAGVPESVDRNININVTLTETEKLEKIKLLAEKHGIPLPQILGTVTDADFVDLKDPDFIVIDGEEY